MSKSKRARRAAAKSAASVRAAEQQTRKMDPAARADLDRRGSGAHGVHADSNIYSASVAAGQTNRVGSRSAQRRAAVRDHL